MECFAIPADSIIIEPYNVKPIEGFELQTGFPDCCPYHKSVKQAAEDWFAIFPNCCEIHSKDAKRIPNFDKANYKNIIDKILIQADYTEHLIRSRINNDDWFADISEYIEYNIHSFGHPAFGSSIYLESVKNYFRISKHISEDKRQMLINYYSEKYEGESESDERDIKVLFDTYARWVKLFPFELSLINIPKSIFQKTLPLLAEEPKGNRYSGLAKAKTKTLNELLLYLTNLTKDLLSKIDTVALLNSGVITEPVKLRLELTNAKHRIATDTLLHEYTKGERKYIKTIKKWLEQEKTYFREISDIIVSKSPKGISETDKLQAELNKYGFFDLSKVKVLTDKHRSELIDILNQKPLPYKIAMLNYLGFIEHTIPKHFSSKFKLQKFISSIFKATVRDVKGNLNVLSPVSKDDRRRYTSHTHIKTVEKDYQNLK